jgi:hypothetical protein
MDFLRDEAAEQNFNQQVLKAKGIDIPNKAGAVIDNRVMNVGNPTTGPLNKTSYSSADALLKATNARLNDALLNTKKDPLYSAKGVSIDATHTGLNFDRYYSHGNFNKLGFSPFRDNEKIYNNNSTWGQDFVRASKQYPTLLGTGFTSVFKNWGSLSSAAADRESAWEMEKAMAIGSSSKKGFGAGFTNFYLNSAYTVGLLGEIGLEELGLFAATALTGGGASELLAIRSAKNLARLTKGLYNSVKAGETISGARKLWNASMNFINPAENLTTLYRGVNRGLEGYKDLSKLALATRTAGAFIKDLRAINLVSSEAKLEAGMVQNEVTNKLIDKHYELYKRVPNTQELNKISASATEAAGKTFMANLAGIYVSNKIVLETALKGFKPFRNIMEDSALGFMESISKKGGQKVVTVLDKQKWGTHIKGVFGLDKGAYWKAVGKGMTPSRIAGNALRYTSANLMEGTQELYQESLSAGLIKQYTDSYFGNGRVIEADILNTLAMGSEELDKNDMGLEVFLSGFAMGGFLGPAQNVIFTKGSRFLAKTSDYFTGQTTLKDADDAREKARVELEKAMTHIANNPEKYASAMAQNMALQNNLVQIAADAEARGDKKDYNGTLDDSMFNHIHTLIRSGKVDFFIDAMKDMQNMTDDELVEAFGDNDSTNTTQNNYNKDIRGRIDSAIKKAETIKDRYDYYKERLPNTYNKNTEFYDWLAHEEAVKYAIYNNYSFERAVDGIQKVTDLLNVLKPLGKIEAGKLTSLVSEDLIQQELKRLDTEIKIYSQGDATQQKKAANLQKQYDTLKDLSSGLFLHISDMVAAKKAALNPEEEQRMRQERKTFVKGAAVEFEGKGGKRVKGKVKRVRDGKVTLEFIDSKTGKRKQKTLAKEKVALVGEPLFTDEELDEEGAPQTRNVEESRAMAYKSFQDYIKVLAESNNDIIDEDQLQQAFAAILDYYDLDSDARSAAEFVNRLIDPEYFATMSQRIKTAIEESQKIAKAKVKEMSEKFMEMHINNMFINELQNMNVFFDPKDVDALVDKNRIPDSFYDATTLKQILPNDERYQKIIELVDKLEQLTGKTATNKPITGANVPMGKFSPRRDTNDNRTIADLAKELGFDPKTGGEVELKKLLDFIINSSESSIVAKKLAQRLRPLVGDRKATIKLDHTNYNTYDPVNGLIIDPRYSTFEYQGGNVNFEYSLINGITTMMISESSTNAEFNTAINNLIAEFKNALDNGNLDNSLKSLGLEGAMMPVDSIESFVTEALTNPAFQQLLELVKTEKKTTTLWEDFVEAVRQVLRSILGVSNENTILDETIALASNKLEPSGVYFKETIAKTDQEITVNTPYNAMPTELKNQLRSAYNGEEDDFEEWVKTSSYSAKIISDYNASVASAAQPTPAAGTMTGPNPLTPKEKNTLRRLKYSPDDINAMTPEEARDIILTNRTKPDNVVIPPTGYRFVEQDENIDVTQYDVIDNYQGSGMKVTNAPKLVPVTTPAFEITITNGEVTANWKGNGPSMSRSIVFKVEEGKIVSAEEVNQQGTLTPVVTPIKNAETVFTALLNSNEWNFTEEEQAPVQTSIPDVNPDSKVLDMFKGSIVYVSSGMDTQTAFDTDAAIISGDDFIVEAFKNSGIELFQDVTKENMYQKVKEFFDSLANDPAGNAQRDAIQSAYGAALDAMRREANKGYTVVTSSQNYLSPLYIGKIDLVIVPKDTSVYFRTESDPDIVQNRRSYELLARKDKKYATVDTDNVLDVLEGNVSPQGTTLNLTSKPLLEQIDSLDSMTAVKDMMYELSLFTDDDYNFIGVSRLEAEKKLQEKLEQVSSTPNFVDVKKGHILVTNTGELLYVTGMYKSKLYYKKIGMKGTGAPMTKNVFDKTIIGVYSQTGDLAMPGAVSDPEAQKQAAENISASIAELTEETKNQIEKEVNGDKNSAKNNINIC